MRNIHRKSCVMKYLFVFLTIIILFACNQEDSNRKALQNQIDNLQSKLDDSYKPGFGEFMSSVQVHHNKLWFAGKNENWELADFEINEIREILQDIEKYQSARPESQSISMITPAIDSVSSAIQHRDLPQFEHSYMVLTNTCTNCHSATKHEFIQIKIPNKNMFSNQEFKLSP